MNTLTALKRSPLGLDLYLWLVYRTFTLRAPKRITWRLLYSQFGAHPDKASNNNTVQAFRYKVPRELKKIKLAWLRLWCGGTASPRPLRLSWPRCPTPFNASQQTESSWRPPGYSVRHC